MSHSPVRALPIVLVVSSAMFMEFLDSTIILTALPKMAVSLHVTPLALSGGITAYLLAVAALLPASGWMADRFGTRRVFMVAIAVFSLASLWCSLSNALWEFLLARCVQGAGAALMPPVGRLAMLRAVDRGGMVRAMNVATMAALTGTLIGPPLGGVITDLASWRWIFLVNVPIGLVGLYFVWTIIPEYRAAARRPFDVRGFLGNGLSLAMLLYGLQLLGESAASGVLTGALLVGGALVGALAIRHARRVSHPLVPLDAFRERQFGRTFAGGMAFRVALFAPHFALALLLQVGLGMSAAVAGLFMACGAVADVLSKLLTVRALRRFGHRAVLLWTCALYAPYPLALMLCSAGTPVVALAGLLAFGGAVRSYHMTASNTLQLGVIDREHLTGASTVWALSQQLAQALGIAAAAVLLHAAVWWRGGDAQRLIAADFRIVMLVAAALSLLALRPYSLLPRAAGAELSGYSELNRRESVRRA